MGKPVPQLYYEYFLVSHRKVWYSLSAHFKFIVDRLKR